MSGPSPPRVHAPSSVRRWWRRSGLCLCHTSDAQPALLIGRLAKQAGGVSRVEFDAARRYASSAAMLPRAVALLDGT